MGMDVFGVEPKSKNGEYFRASIWGWQPIWSILQESCREFLSREDLMGLSVNEGYEVSASKSVSISNKLAMYLEYNTDGLEIHPEDTVNCQHMVSFLNELTDQLGDGGDVEKVIAGNDGRFSATDDLIKEFSDFCRSSGGFKVW